MATLKTRINQKHDTEANWNKATNFIPNNGELIVYDIDSSHSCPRIKIGNGVANVISLPFITDNINDTIDAHINNHSNPHQVTKAQVGLGAVPNVNTQNADNITSGVLSNYRMNSAPAAYNMNPVISGSNRIYSNLGRPTLAEMACIDSEWTNKIWFYDVDKLHFEIQATESSEWEDITSTIGEENIRNLVDGGGDDNPPVAFRIPRNTYRYRITVDPKTYVFLNAIYMSASANGNRLGLTVEGLNQKTQIWDTLGDSENTTSGWPANFWFQHKQLALVHYQSTADKMYDKARIVIKPEWLDSNTNAISVFKIQWWGGYSWGWRTVYTWDNRKNVTFPAALKATTLTAGNVSINSSCINNNNAIINYPSSNGTMIISSTPSVGTTSSPVYISDGVVKQCTNFHLDEGWL